MWGICPIKQYVTKEERETKMNNDFTQGNIFKNLVKFSIPFFLSYFMQTLYGLADMFIIGQFNGAEVITAVSIGSQIMHMLTVIIVGIAMGTTVMIGRYVGAKKQREVAAIIGNSVTVFLVISIALCVILLACMNPIINIMSTPVESVEQTRYYLIICFIGIPFITAYNVISSIFRGLGDSKSPMYFIAIACSMNIVLDIIFIGVMGMQSQGAALGTVLAQTGSVIFALFSILKRDMGISISRKDFIPEKKAVLDILKIGFPVAVQDGFIQISFIIITVIANTRGVEIAAAVGIVEKIIGIMFLVPSSMLSAISALAAQNVGAGLHKRASRTLFYGVYIAVGFGILCSLITEFRAEQIVSLFINDAEVIVYGKQYLSSYVVDCIVAGIHFCFSGYFCAYGKSIVSFIHNLCSIVLVRIPGAYLASIYFPDTLFPMGMAAPAGSLLSALICVGVYLVLFKGKEFSK